jgi:glycyl-tRNA synthetase beta subunit
MKQMEEEIELRGPPVAKAFDQEGRPTKAAEGFCRKNNVLIDSLYRRTDGTRHGSLEFVLPTSISMCFVITATVRVGYSMVI